MRYGTAEQLRREGYGDDAPDGLAELRSAIERFLRGPGDDLMSCGSLAEAVCLTALKDSP